MALRATQGMKDASLTEPRALASRSPAPIACDRFATAERNQNRSREFQLLALLTLVFLYSLIGTCCAFITSSRASTVGGDGLKLPKR